MRSRSRINAKFSSLRFFGYKRIIINFDNKIQVQLNKNNIKVLQIGADFLCFYMVSYRSKDCRRIIDGTLIIIKKIKYFVQFVQKSFFFLHFAQFTFALQYVIIIMQKMD